MIYLKEFSTENDYLTYRDGKDYLKPNVSLCDDNGSVFYNFTPPPIVYEAVDLGLPSGTLWATCNVGASKPSDAGLYFQWGDTIGYTADQVGTGDGKKAFSWADYKWSVNGSSSNFSKYKTPGAILDLEDDAAHVNMGGDWHMPTPEQIQELINETDNTWTTQGRLFKSKKDDSKSIFVPAAGYAYYDSLHNEGSEADVWSSVLGTNSVGRGQYLYFNSSNVYLDNYFRYYGFSVRGVLG